MSDPTTRPRITVMGEEVSWDEVPPAQATELVDHFRPVKLSPQAIDQASKLVPAETYKDVGLYTWLSKRADHVFKHLPTDQLVGQLGIMRFVFEFDAFGPVLKKVYLSANPPQSA